jgi:hypothetical protein
MSRRNELGVVFIALYVDDCLCIGDDAAIKDLIKGMESQGLTLKVDEELTDYLSCQIDFLKDGTQALIGQPHLLKNLESKFASNVKASQAYRTPGTPGVGIVQPKDDSEKISSEEKTDYRSGVGMLLFLVKHSWPDIANPVRELSTCMDGATRAAVKELYRVIKFTLDTKDYGLLLKPDKLDVSNWDMVMYTDSDDYAGDNDSRISVTGFILFLCGVAFS